MKDYILSLAIEAPMHRLPWWLKNAGEVTWPVHDSPAVWESWGLHGGGLPRVEALLGAPVTAPRYGASPEDGLPTLVPLSSDEEGR